MSTWPRRLSASMREAVHRLADHGVFGIHVGSKASGHHGARVHADAQKHLGQALGQVGKVQLAHGDLHLHRAQRHGTSSSRATGAPNSTMIESPMNLSIVPWYLNTTSDSRAEAAVERPQ